MKKIAVLGIGILMLTGCDRITEEITASLGADVLGEEISTDHPDYQDTVAALQGCTVDDPTGALCAGIISQRTVQAISDGTLGITIAAGLNTVAEENAEVLQVLLEQPELGMPARTLCGMYRNEDLGFCNVALNRNEVN